MGSLLEEALHILREEGYSLPDDVMETLTGIQSAGRRPEDRYGALSGGNTREGNRTNQNWTEIRTSLEGTDSQRNSDHRFTTASSARYGDDDRGFTSESGYDTEAARRSRVSDSDRDGSDKRHSYDKESLPYNVSYPPSETGFSDRRPDSGLSNKASMSFKQNSFERSESSDSTSTTSTVKEAHHSGSNPGSLKHEGAGMSSAASDSGVGCSSTHSNVESTLDKFGFDIAGVVSQDARVDNLRNNSKDIANKLSEQIGGQGWAQSYQSGSTDGKCNEVSKQDNTTIATQSQSVGASSSMESKQELKRESGVGSEAQVAEKKYSDESKSDFTKTSKKTEHEGATENELCVEKKDTSKTFSSEMDTACFSKQDGNSVSQGSTTTSKQDSGYFAADSQLNTSEISTEDGRKLKRQESISSTATSASMSHAKVSEEQHVAKNVDAHGNVIEDVSKSSRQESSSSQTSSTSSSSVVKEDRCGRGDNKSVSAIGDNRLSRQDSLSSSTSAQSSKTLKEERFEESKSSTTKQGSSSTSSSKVTSSKQSTSESKSESKESRGQLSGTASPSSYMATTAFNKQENNIEDKSKQNSNTYVTRPNTTPNSAMGPSVYDSANRYYVSEPRTPCPSETGYGITAGVRSGRLSSQASNLSRQDSTTSSIDSSASAMQRRMANEGQSSFDDNVFDTSSMDSTTRLKEAAEKSYRRCDSDNVSSPRRTPASGRSSADKRGALLASMERSSFENDSKYGSGSKIFSEIDEIIDTYSSRTLPSRRNEGYSRYGSSYAYPYSSQDDLQGINTKRTSRTSSNRRATLHDGFFITEKEVFEARQDVRKLISADGDAYVTTRDSTRKESTVGRGTGGTYKTSTQEDKIDSITKEFIKMEEDVCSGLKHKGIGEYKTSQRVADLSNRDLRESLLMESRSPAFGGDRYSRNADTHDKGLTSAYCKTGPTSASRYLSEGQREPSFLPPLETGARGSLASSSAAGKSMALDLNSSSISTSRRAGTGDSYKYNNDTEDYVERSRRQGSTSNRRHGETGVNMGGASEFPQTYNRCPETQGGKASGLYENVAGLSKKEEKSADTTCKGALSANQIRALKADDKASWNERRKRIDTALSWIRSELGTLRSQDKLLTSQFQRCQDSIEQLKKQRPWYDDFSDEEDDDDRHWEDWEIEDFDRACQNEKRDVRSQLDPSKETPGSTRRQDGAALK